MVASIEDRDGELVLAQTAKVAGLIAAGIGGTITDSSSGGAL